MAKRSKKKTAKRTVSRKRPVKKAAAQATRPNLLGAIRGAIAHRHARPILGRLSPDDLDILARHLSAGTLMRGLTPIADTSSKDEAVNSMPRDIGGVVAKLSDGDVANLRRHLRLLKRDSTNAVVCPC